MKGKRFKEEQIIAILKQAEAGVPHREVCRQHGVSVQSFFRWKAKFGGMEISDAKSFVRLRPRTRGLSG